MGILKTKFGPGWLATTLLGVANGVAQLGADGKLSASVLPAGVGAGFNRKGNFDASTGAYPANPTDGDFYVVSVAGTVAGRQLTVGDSIYYTGATSSWNVIDQSRSTDELPEGSTNLYSTPARIKAAAVVNSLTGGATDQAPSVAAVAAALAGKANATTRNKERFVLSSTDVTNGYVTLSRVAMQYSLNVGVQGLGLIEESLDGTAGDYAVSNDGAGGNTKLTFKNDLATGGATPLAAGDVVFVQYSY